ncbi:hypothetical protein ACOME3_003881 [Neoechinorhynchus agilis]
MGKACKLMVCGLKAVGKSYMLNVLSYGTIPTTPYFPTLEDTYVTLLDKESGLEARLYDTQGLSGSNAELSTDPLQMNVCKAIPVLLHAMDGIVLVYRAGNMESLHQIQNFTLYVECLLRTKNAKKEAVRYMVLGIQWNEEDDCHDTRDLAQAWKASEENILLWKEILLNDTESLRESFAIFAKEICVPQSRSGFTIRPRKR